MKNFLPGKLFTLVALAIGACAGSTYLQPGFAEVRADIPPSRWERALMFSAAHACVRRRAPAGPNLVPATDENFIAGGKVYLDECGGCHGMPAKEGHPNVLYPPIAQLSVSATTYRKSQIFFGAKHGDRFSGMFANGNGIPTKALDRSRVYQARQVASSAR
jgi:hypothetical protein